MELQQCKKYAKTKHVKNHLFTSTRVVAVIAVVVVGLAALWLFSRTQIDCVCNWSPPSLNKFFNQNQNIESKFDSLRFAKENTF